MCCTHLLTHLPAHLPAHLSARLAPFSRVLTDHLFPDQHHA